MQPLVVGLGAGREREGSLWVHDHTYGRERQPTSSEGSTSGPPARATVLNGECTRVHLTPDTGYDTSHTHRIISADIECLALWRNPRSPSAQRRRDRVGDAARQGCGGVCRIRREVP